MGDSDACGWTMESPPGALTRLNGRDYLYFAGTGYLGLQGRPELIEAAVRAAKTFGVHSATSRSGFGTTAPVVEVERRAAEFLGVDGAIYLASGYACNFAVAATLAEQVDFVLVDECAHDSLRESARMLTRVATGAMFFRHCDAGHVEELLAKHIRPRRRVLVMTDGVVPVSGRLPPLADYLSILGRYDRTMLLVDDAHGLAVLGELGRGSLELAGAACWRMNRDPDEWTESSPRLFHASTLSKAVGGHGGVVAGSRGFLGRVRRGSGWVRAASAPAAPVAAATAKGLELVQADPTLRSRLAENVARLRTGLRSTGLDVAMTPSPIIGFALESAERMSEVQSSLAAQGILIAYSRDYVGAGRNGMLRIAVFASHTPEMIDRLVAGLRATI